MLIGFFLNRIIFFSFPPPPKFRIEDNIFKIEDNISIWFKLIFFIERKSNLI